jgi:hypothetical protein
MPPSEKSGGNFLGGGIFWMGGGERNTEIISVEYEIPVTPPTNFRGNYYN